MARTRQVREELADVAGPHLSGVTLAVEEDKIPDPAEVCLLRPDAVVLQDRGLSDSTIKHTRRVCKLFIKYAVWKKYLRESPLEGLELPKGAEPRETRSLTPAEARTLVETALLDLGDPIFVFALFTGMRPKECLGLPLSNVELVDDALALVRVTQQAVKLRRAPGHIFTRPKTRKGVREVPFPAWLYRELMRLQCANAAPARVLGAGWTDYDLAFPSRTGRPISEGGCATCSRGS